MSRILYVWLPNWPLQRLRVARPGLGERTIVLYQRQPRGSFRVVSASPAHGIRPGMSLAEATALVQAHHDAQQTTVHLEPHDPVADRLALEELACWCERFSPTVGLDGWLPPEGLLLDVTGLAHLFGGEASLVEQVGQALRQRGLIARLGLADTMGAAWAVARHAMPRCRRVSSGLASALLIPAGQTWSAVRSLPVAALRLPDETLTLLSRLGLRQIGQVAALPREAVSSRLGRELLLRLDQLSGAAAEVLQTHRPAEQMAACWDFESPTDRPEALEAALSELLPQVLGPLAARREGALHLVCRFVCQGAETIERSVGLFRSTAAVEHVGQLLRLQLESLRLAAPVSAVRLEVTSTAPLEVRQQELFAADRWRDAPRHLAELVDRLSSRLGRQAVTRPYLQHDVQPEYACLELPLTGHPRRGMNSSQSSRSRSKRPARSKQPTTPRQLPGPRPLWLYLQPKPLEVLAIDANGLPDHFRLDRQAYRRAAYYGPERIETGWWRRGGIRRDYYRLQTERGNHFWLFRQLRDGGWFCQGEFA